VIGILAAFLGTLGLFNPRGRPFVFQSEVEFNHPATLSHALRQWPIDPGVAPRRRHLCGTLPWSVTHGLFRQSLQLFRDDIPAAFANMASAVQHYAMPRWHFAAYFLLIVYITYAADTGVKYSTLRCSHLRLLSLRTCSV